MRTDDGALERWLPVPGYEGLYEVSDMGRVRALRRRGSPGGLLAAKPNSGGYPRVSLWENRRVKYRGVHQLVALAFIGPRPEGQEVRHLDGNPLNSVLANLAYGTPSENVQDCLRHGTHHLASKTRCKNGHEFTDENTYRYRGKRICRACRRKPSAVETSCEGDHHYYTYDRELHVWVCSICGHVK